MKMTGTETRLLIIETADRLFYEHGYDSTSFAQIAQAVGISRGNFYHHFKAKDDILAAVINLRLERTQAMLEDWDHDAESPAGRIRAFIHILITNQSQIMRHGCPVGTLCNELAKLNHSAKPQAARIFGLFRVWLARQFTLLGHAEQADALALHVLMLSQGIATLATATGDESFLRREVAQAFDWLNSLSENTPPSPKTMEIPACSS